MPRLPSIPKLELASDWRAVLRHAWSVRLLALAALLSFLEVVLNLVGSELPLPPLGRALVTGVVVAGALVARIVAQKQFSGEKE